MYLETFHKEKDGSSEDAAWKTEVESCLGIPCGLWNMCWDRKANQKRQSPDALDVSPTSGVMLDFQPFVSVDLERDLHASDEEAVNPDKH